MILSTHASRLVPPSPGGGRPILNRLAHRRVLPEPARPQRRRQDDEDIMIL
jgi:hypothetical protein